MPINEAVPLLKGFYLTNEELKKITDKEELFTLVAETSNICNLNCRYCFRDVYGTKNKLENELSLEQRLDLIKQAEDLGCKVMIITGAGEPTIDKDFFEMIEYANSLGIMPIVFTNGLAIDRKMAKRFFDLGASLILKCSSMNPEVEDNLVGRRGYCERRNNVLKILIETGFNKTNPTRLGFDGIVTQINKNDVIDIIRFCRENNIFPLFTELMLKGGAVRMGDLKILRNEIDNISKEVSEIDREKYGINYIPEIPYIGGLQCRLLHHSLYVNILGEIYSCVGSKILLGNIRNASLKDIFNSDSVKKIRDTPYNSCPFRKKV